MLRAGGIDAGVQLALLPAQLSRMVYVVSQVVAALAAWAVKQDSAVKVGDAGVVEDIEALVVQKEEGLRLAVRGCFTVGFGGSGVLTPWP